MYIEYIEIIVIFSVNNIDIYASIVIYNKTINENAVYGIDI